MSKQKKDLFSSTALSHFETGKHSILPSNTIQPISHKSDRSLKPVQDSENIQAHEDGFLYFGLILQKTTRIQVSSVTQLCCY